jgi:hypothetical protein
MVRVNLDIDGGTYVHWSRSLPVYAEYHFEELYNLYEALDLAGEHSKSGSEPDAQIHHERLLGARIHVTKRPYDEIRTKLDKDVAVSYQIQEGDIEKVTTGINRRVGGQEWGNVRRELISVLEAVNPPVYVYFEFHQPQSTAKTIDLSSDAFDGDPWKSIETLTEKLTDETMLDSLAARAFVAVDCYNRRLEEVCNRDNLEIDHFRDALERGRLIVEKSQAVDSILRSTARYESTIGDADIVEFMSPYDEPEHYKNVDKVVTDFEYVGQAFSIVEEVEFEILYVVGAAQGSTGEVSHVLTYRLGPGVEPAPALVSIRRLQSLIRKGKMKKVNIETLN